MKRTCLLLVLQSLLLNVESLLPFLKPCPRQPKGPEWEACLLDSFNEAYPYIIKGDPKWKLPQMDPLYEDELLIERGSDILGITIDITNATITGLTNGSSHSVYVDLEEGYMNLGILVEELNLTSDYYMSGKILTFHLNASGDDYVSMQKLNGSLKINYTMVPDMGNDGIMHEYYTVDNVTVDLDAKLVEMQFNNLFNGNQWIEDYANRFFSRNWREIFRLLGPGVNKALAKVVNKMLTDAKEHLALDELFPHPKTHEPNSISAVE